MRKDLNIRDADHFGADMKHVPTCLVLLTTTFSAPALAQDSQQHFEDIASAAFESAIREYDIPGLIVGVTRDGKHSFYQTGLASREDQRPVTPDTLFELGSISKIFNVTLAAIAEGRGMLSLDSPLATYLPTLKGTSAGGLRLMDLTTHHSGGLPLQLPDEV